FYTGSTQEPINKCSELILRCFPNFDLLDAMIAFKRRKHRTEFLNKLAYELRIGLRCFSDSKLDFFR
ncbi:hypothetical protein C1X44_34525, partial [Pseudomonas sp. MPR-AND1A]